MNFYTDHKIMRILGIGLRKYDVLINISESIPFPIKFIVLHMINNCIIDAIMNARLFSTLATI